LVVKEAAVANPIAQDHQAIGCRSRGSALEDGTGPVTARQTSRLRRATTALPAIAIASRPTMLQVTAAGIRAGSSALGSTASAAGLAVESPGDSTSESVSSASSLARESPGDLSSTEPSSDPFFEPSLARESPGDSLASGDAEGLDGVPEGVDCGDEPEPPPEAGDGLADGLDDCDPPPPDGVAVGDDGEEVGDELGDDVGVGVAVGVLDCTGGATPGGTAPLEARSCCQDQPTEPPAGTVSEPEAYDEYVHDPFDPSAHQSPQ
jgi:hypothetical protein